LVERARMVELALQGRFLCDIARELKTNENTVRMWLQRFTAKGIEGLADRPRSGCPGVYTREEIAEVIATAQRSRFGLRLLDPRPPRGLPQRGEGHRH